MQTEFEKILLDFKSIPQFKRTKTFLEIAGYPHYENVCSNILKFYLDPTNEHGLKDLVLNSLLHVVDNNFYFDVNFEEIKIYREFQTRDGNSLDLLILTDNFAIGIENKIFHHLHNNLTDYNNTVKSECFNSRKAICIVLSLSKLTLQEDINKLRDNEFFNVTYEQLFQNIKKDIGGHLGNANMSFVNHFSDFIKSIENLTPQTMENKALWSFFKNNSQTIQKLTDSYSEYRKSLYEKIDFLISCLNQDVPSKNSGQWIGNSRGRCLAYDYKINNKYRLAVDTCIDTNGWEIRLFGRDKDSTEYIFNEMFKGEKNILPNSIEDYKIVNNSLIYINFDTDIDIESVATTLTDLLSRIEKYKLDLNE